MNNGQADDARRQLGAILELSRGMLAAAERGEWEALGPLEARRRQALQSLFSLDGVMHVTGVPDGVRELLALDRRLIERGEVMRRQAGDELGRIDQGRRAIRAYRGGYAG